MKNAHLIVASLERAGELCDDLAPWVYDRLFDDHPDMRALFVRDTDGSVRGEMLARVIEAILDFVDRRAYAAHMIQCEVVTHEGYGAPSEVLGLFFSYVAGAVARLVGADWTIDTDAAWRVLLADLDDYVTHPDQAATLALA